MNFRRRAKSILLSQCILECSSYDCRKLSEFAVKLKFIYHWSFSWIATPIFLFTLRLIKAKGDCRSQVSHIYPMTFSMFRFGYLSDIKFSTIAIKIVFCSVCQVKFIYEHYISWNLSWSCQCMQQCLQGIAFLTFVFGYLEMSKHNNLLQFI